MKQLILKMYFYFFGILAKIYLKRHKPLVIGVTGSIGKTSCRMIISQILSQNLTDKVIYTSNKNFNGELGLSLSVLGISNYVPSFIGIINIIFESVIISLFGKKKYDIIFLEYGIDHIGEMDFLLSIIKPDFGIVTKIDKVHSAQFGTSDIIATEKYKLLQKTKLYSYLNIDCEYSLKYEDKIKTQKIFYTTDISKTHQKLNLTGVNSKLVLEDNIPKINFELLAYEKEIFEVSSNMIGTENIGYISLGYDILDKIYQKFYKSGFFEESVNKKIDLNLDLQESRFSTFYGVNNSILIDSTYNAAPGSMGKVIDNFNTLCDSLYPYYEKILVLGEMRELGVYSKEEHEKLSQKVSQITNNIFVVGDDMKKYFVPKIIELGNENVRFYKNSKLLGEDLKSFVEKSNKKYIILFKGSQNTIFLEEAVKILQLNEKDNSKVCRQQEFWLNNKNNFFDKK